jgi:hypothetical protein
VLFAAYLLGSCFSVDPLDKALRIRREESLPVLERPGDAPLTAVELTIAEPIRNILKAIGAPDPIRDHP